MVRSLANLAQHQMGIKKLDVFFTTQLTLDQPNVFNSATNFLFTPLHYVFGQNKYQSLQGKVTKVDNTTPTVAEPTYGNLKKIANVFMLILAIIPALFGSATRYLSFWDSNVDQAYSIAFLSQLTPSEHNPKIIEPYFAFLLKKTTEERNKLLEKLPDPVTTMFLSLDAHQTDRHAFLLHLPEESRSKVLSTLSPAIQSAFLNLETNRSYAVKSILRLEGLKFNTLMSMLSPALTVLYITQKAKKEPLDNYLKEAIASLKTLQGKLQEDRSVIERWLQERTLNPSYPFPFHLAAQLETNLQIRDRADPALCQSFLDLRRLCTARLTALGLESDETNLFITTKKSALESVQSTFKVNLSFFKVLSGQLDDHEKPTSEITKWLQRQQLSTDYTYPFHTHFRILTFMESLTKNPANLQPFTQNFTECLRLLELRNVENYDTSSSEENASELAIKRLRNIYRLQVLITEQSTDAMVSSQRAQAPESMDPETAQNLKRQQAQSGTSVAEDLDALIEEALNDLNGRPDVSAPASAGSTPSLGPAESDLDFNQLQYLLVKVAVTTFFDSTYSSELESGLEGVSQQINLCIRQLDQFFQKLLQQEKTIKKWVENERREGGPLQCHPLAASHFLTVHLDKTNTLKASLDQDLVAQWQQNYRRCVVLLKQNGLDSFVETEFPFEETHREHLKQFETWFQDPQVIEQMRAGIAHPEVMGQSIDVIKKGLLPLQAFFTTIDQLLKDHPNDPAAIDSWLKSEASKANYMSPFYLSTQMFSRMPPDQLPPFLLELRTLFQSCCTRLTAMGLERYPQEGPSPTTIALETHLMSSMKETHQPAKPDQLTAALPSTRSAPSLTSAAPSLIQPSAFVKDPRYPSLIEEIEGSIQAPQEHSSLLLSRHIQVYLKDYPGVLEALLPPALLTRWKETCDKALTKGELPIPDGHAAVITFFQNLLKKQAQEGDNAAASWLDAQKTEPGYVYPFFHPLYCLSIARDNPKLKMVTLFHEKVVAWAHLAQQESRLLETPPHRSPGLCLLVHTVTENCLQRKIAVLPSSPPVSAPTLRLSPTPHQVDDKVFKAVIGNLVPRFGRLLENERMFPFWKYRLLEFGETTFISLISLYQDVQKKKTKREIIAFLNLPIKQGMTVTLLSKHYVEMATQLEPLLPPRLAKIWKEEYDKCCAFLRNKDVKIDGYLNAAIPAFFSENVKQFESYFSQSLKMIITILEESTRVSDGDLDQWIKQKIEEHNSPFFWVRELDDLVAGYDVRLNAQDLTTLKQLFEKFQKRVRDLKLEQTLLDEPPPQVNRADLDKLLHALLSK